MRSRLLLFLLLLCLPCWGLGGPWSYYYPLTYDHTKVGASDSASFPALVYFSATAMKDSGHGGDVQSSAGADVEFFSDSALTTQIPSELDYYDNVNGIGWFWVQITTLSHLANGTIYMAVGNGSPPARTANPWDTHYGGVWHLGSGTTLSYVDSTANGNTGTPQSASAVAGQIAGGFGGDDIYTNTSASDNPLTAGTFSAWVYPTSTSNLNYVITNGTGGNAYTNGQLLGINNGNAVMFLPAATLGGATSAGTVSTNAWHYLAGAWNSTTVTVYLDGTPTSESTSSSPSTSGALTFKWSSDQALYRNLQGSMDEARVSNVVRSPDWITAEYNNQLSPGNIGAAAFWTFGAKTGASRRRVIVVN